MEKNEKEFILRQKNGQYQHVGNTRVTFRDGVNKGEPYWDWSNYTYIAPDNTGYDDGVVTKEDIVQINHYYPFGLNMEGDWNGAPGKNKYQYNGKEWNEDFGLGWNDYGARMYDPAIARWSTKDPLAEHYTNISPYTYVVNNPTLFTDPTGMAVEEMSDRTRYTGDDAKLAFMSIKAHVNAKNFNGNVLNNLTSTVNKFGDEFSAAQEATKTDGYERGFVIYSDATGLLHSSAMIKGTQKVISEEWVDELEKPTAKNVDVANLSLTGIYHTHTNTGLDNNPFSDGDIMQLFINIQNGHYWNGTKRWTINTGFFVIADDVAGGRYAAVIEDFSKASIMNNRTRDQYNAAFDDYVGSNNFAEGTAGQKARIFYGALFLPSTGIGIYHNSGNQSKNLNRINK